MWRFSVNNDGGEYVFRFPDQERTKGASLLKKFFGEKPDQISYLPADPVSHVGVANLGSLPGVDFSESEFTQRYITRTTHNKANLETAERNRDQTAQVIISQRKPREHGVLELGDPTRIQKRPDPVLRPPSKERRLSHERVSEGGEEKRSAHRGLRQVITRRETRSQTANAKMEPYLEYAATSAKRKVTVLRDDLGRLNEDEFLNDTIIEFYLMYPLSPSPLNGRAEAPCPSGRTKNARVCLC